MLTVLVLMNVAGFDGVSDVVCLEEDEGLRVVAEQFWWGRDRISPLSCLILRLA